MVRLPFVTSIVLVTALPDSEASRPYAVIAGHMWSCAAGLAALFLLGPGNHSSAVGVGLAALGMLAIRAPHPPAGIDAFMITANALHDPKVEACGTVSKIEQAASSLGGS